MAKDSKELEQTKRLMGQLLKMPHKPHEPLKRKLTKGKGRVRVGKSGS